MLTLAHKACFTRLLICTLLGVTLVASAQELEPRRWSHLPVGSHVGGTGYAYARGDIDFNPVLLIEDARMDVHTLAFKYIQTFAVLGKSARIDLMQGYQWGRWEGRLDGEQASTERAGLSDSVARFSAALLGAPPLRGKDFAAYRAARQCETIVGTGLAIHLPTGNYHSDKLLNLGSNRVTLRPQLGVIHNRGKWSTELTGATWFFTDNDDFFKGKRLENDPLYTLQAHLVYQFKPGFWWAGGAGYGYGAESSLNGTRKDDCRESIAWGTSLGYPITRRLAATLGYVGTRTQTLLGANTDTVVTALSLFW